MTELRCVVCNGRLVDISPPTTTPTIYVACPTKHECGHIRTFGPDGHSGPQWLDILVKEAETNGA